MNNFLFSTQELMVTTQTQPFCLQLFCFVLNSHLHSLKRIIRIRGCWRYVWIVLKKQISSSKNSFLFCLIYISKVISTHYVEYFNFLFLSNDYFGCFLNILLIISSDNIDIDMIVFHVVQSDKKSNNYSFYTNLTRASIIILKWLQVFIVDI